MEFWINLWKIVLIVGISAFLILAVVVSIWGFIDIKKMFKILNAEHKEHPDNI